MFRLVKVLNGNNQYEVMKLGFNASDTIVPGCALTCSNGKVTPASSTAMPDYVALTGSEGALLEQVDAMYITEDMVFKVEFTGSVTPTLGMNVAIANGKYKSDSVSYNSSGKGSIIGIEDDKKYVYVRFRK